MNRLFFAAIALCLALPALAQDVALDSGEFRNTADTTPKGELILHPLLRSQIGIVEHFDLKASVLGFLVTGPQLAAEYQFLDTRSLKLSIEPEGNLRWGFRTYGAGASLRATIPAGVHRVNVSVGARYGQYYIFDADLDTVGTQTREYTALTLPINLGFDYVVDDSTAVRFVLNTSVETFPDGAYSGTFAVNWNHSLGENFRIAVGVVIVAGGTPDFYTLMDNLGLPRGPFVLPLPTFEMWWRI